MEEKIEFMDLMLCINYQGGRTEISLEDDNGQQVGDSMVLFTSTFNKRFFLTQAEAIYSTL